MQMVSTLLPYDRIPATIIILSGVISHISFNRLEPRSLGAILSLLLGPPTVLVLLLRTAYSNTFSALTTSLALYLGTLICSVVAYRLSPFHPLAAFPGPIICKITRLWAWYIVYGGNQHRYYKSLHDRYGTHVRTGPNHVLVCDVDAIQPIMGPKGLPRGGRYEVTKLPGTTGSLLSLTDLHEHTHRRRVWERGLNMSAVQGYHDVLFRRVSQLLDILEKQVGQVDLSFWISCLSFDFMGDLAFGGAFQLMQQGHDPEGYMRMVQLGSRHQELAGTIPWVKPINSLLPSAKGYDRFVQFAKESVLARKAQESSRKDIFYYLLDEEGVGSGPPSLPTLTMESGLAIGAGSDTTGTTISNLFFYLISNPKAFSRLQAEVDNAFPPGLEVYDSAVVKDMRFLNAVINETLRLQPAVPNGVQRVVSRGGTMIARRWIPGETTVQVPTYTIHRDPRYFSPNPDSFLPERWLDPLSGTYKLEQLAFIPFSYGPMSCVGKNLALLELRIVTCALVQRFEFEFAPGWGPRDWQENLSDSFILAKGSMPVIVKPRQ